MKITEEHVEWATVDRMRDMLVNVHDDYKVTHTYALFTAILCWVMQRVRTDGDGHLDRRARSVFAVLENEQISGQPWKIWTTEDHERHEVQDLAPHGPFTDFNGFDAARFLTTLRNATAHGDARNIRPINRGGFLVGHEFRCSEKERGRVIWRGRIVLERRDMRRIGIALADRYCEALADHRDGEANLHFEADARTIGEAVA